VADSESLGRGFLDSENKRATDGEKHPPSNDSQASSLADAGGQGLEVERQQQAWGQCQTLERGSQVNPWQHPDWLFCRDGKARPTEPSIFPLVNGIPADLVCGSNPGMPANETAEARTMRLRGYGNAIVPQLAAQFIAAVMRGK
jgi:DNA (cytosine-5)-methyltransferase 1